MAFTDTFTEASDTNLESHTPSGGTAWTRVDGVAGAAVVNAAADGLLPVSNTNTLYLCDDQGASDHYAQFTIQDVSLATTNAVCCRATDSNNFIGVRTFTVSGGRRALLIKRVSGTITTLGTSTTGLVNGDTIRIECSGTNVKVKVNGATEVDVTESDHSSVTRQGFCVRSSLSAVIIDNFEAGSLVGTGGEAALLTSVSTTGQTTPSVGLTIQL